MKKLTKNNTIALEEASLRVDFYKTFPPFIIYLATVIILLSFSKDLVRVGFKPYWLLIRVAYLPFILSVWQLAKLKSKNSWYELPLWAASLYITCFCTYFSFATGGLKSDYIFGLIQLYFAIALMPITAISFYLTTFISILIYVGGNLYEFGLSHHPDRATTSTLVPLIVFSIVVYIINSKIRKSKIDLQNTLYSTIKKRDAVIREQAKKLAAIETKGALGILASQVAHDIRSPLAALNILTNQDLSIPEQSRILVRNVITRIRDIANDLVEKNTDPQAMVISNDEHTVQLLAAVIYPLITEKRLQLQSKPQITIEFEPNAANYGLFAKCNLSEFKRMLSNLINNAIDAVAERGHILISLSSTDQKIQLIISDNGKGIPADILKELGKLGMSYGKPRGTGLGLYHAKNTMSKLGGDLKIQSTVNKGTQVILTLPKASIPHWFLPKLELRRNITIVILDDDISIHHLWKERLNIFSPHLTIFHFTSGMEFETWYVKQTAELSPSLFLFDLELFGQMETGLKIIEKYQLQNHSILVTSHFEEKAIHTHCEKLGVKMIPKDLAAFVPIESLPSD